MSSLRAFLNPGTPHEPGIILPSEDIETLREACVSSSTGVIQHLDSQFGDFDEHMKRQIKAVEAMASDAHKQAETAERQVDILEQQLAFVKSEAEAAKKDARFSKIMAMLAFSVSVVAVIAPLLYG